VAPKLSAVARACHQRVEENGAKNGGNKDDAAKSAWNLMREAGLRN
jgi:hypothetical protein